LSTTGVETYNTPLTTTGVVSKLAVIPVWTIATCMSDATLWRVIWVSDAERAAAQSRARPSAPLRSQS
jgi:hypothetical protein